MFKRQLLQLLSNKSFLILSALIIILMSVYGQVITFGFISFDDQDYVTDNAYVQSGLNLKSLRWAFSFVENDLTYWHPLTYVSHMTDCELFGTHPGLHHLSSLILHSLNTCLLFFALLYMTGDRGKSGFAAFLFALHPMGVDSVAWISQRKTLLLTTFWLLSLVSYASYVRKGGACRYLIVCILVASGLMSKPVMVTIPIVFLLMDYWPLKRFHSHHTNQSVGIKHQVISLLREKLPFAVLAALWGITPFIPEHVTAKGISLGTVSMGLRLKNAVVSYMIYLKKFIWPTELALLYPYPEHVGIIKSVTALICLLMITIVIVKYRKSSPYLVSGWFWFVLTLVPFIGIVQGAVWPAYADRFAYVPYIGLYVCVSWGTGAVIQRFQINRGLVSACALVLIGTMGVVTFNQVRYWKNSISVYEHALSVTEKNYIVHNNLGTAYEAEGRLDDAQKQYWLSLWAKPGFSKAYHNLAINYLRQGKTDLAVDHFLLSLKSNPDNYVATFNLGTIYMEQGRDDKAKDYYEKTLEIEPGFSDAHNNMATLYTKEGNGVKSLEHLRKALAADPENLTAICNLGNLLFDLERYEEAAICFSRVIGTDPDHETALNDYGVSLMAMGRYHEAVEQFNTLIQKNPENTLAARNLIAAQSGLIITEEILEKALRVSEQHPGQPEPMAAVAFLYEQSGEYETAESWYIRAINADPAYVEGIAKAALFFEKTRQLNKAVHYYDRLADAEPDRKEDAYYQIASMYAMQKNDDIAVEWLQKAADEGFEKWDMIKADHRFNAIRHSKRYLEFMLVATSG